MNGAFNALLDRLVFVVDERDEWKARAEQAEAERDALKADVEKYRRLKELMETWWGRISCFPWHLPGDYCAHIDNAHVRRPVSATFYADPLEALEAAVKMAEEDRDDA